MEAQGDSVKIWDHPANKRKALFLSSWNSSIARVGEAEVARFA
jgi:hypothetical protein